MISAQKLTAAEAAQYIGGMAKELRSLATTADLGFLAYLLSMVEQEAATAAPPRGQHDRRSGAGEV